MDSKLPSSSSDGHHAVEIEPVPLHEFHDRLSRLQSQLRQRNLAAAIIDDQEILSYITNYERTVSYYRACIVPAHGDPVMVLRALDLDPFHAASWVVDAIGYQDDEDPVDRIAEVVRRLETGSRRIGLDFGSHALTVATFHRLQAALAPAELHDLGPLLWENRLIKSPREIALLKAAAAIADRVALEIAERARAGLSTRDVAAYAARRFLELGASQPHTGPITAGKGWGFLHAGMSSTPLAPGDILHLELTPRVRGYSARLMRPVAIGSISAEQRENAEILVHLQDQQFSAMRVGATAHDVDAVLRQGVLKNKLRDSYSNITGYTLGFYGSTAIRSSDFTRVFKPREQWKLEAGMVFHMYTSAKGLAFSETIHVTDEGPVRLTGIRRQILPLS
ncbi:Xaa-Pro peptidase family protein [Bosea sp. (in: a-proteobacteria)]|uniref:M24 family metallopeptidase n=1 Tax=Bosea sp. (in: a-proteobacteria) TaxID=1871050 RepID=UPI00260C6613|nr:Xaa-Pro peptidase family protein [Bosea sp. (in: a-proteobacteria)]MCO5089782.1 Xaa-Pro peptidase family protein [Bosea sp. (in: a-proteobacteria)]